MLLVDLRQRRREGASIDGREQRRKEDQSWRSQDSLGGRAKLGEKVLANWTEGGGRTERERKDRQKHKEWGCDGAEGGMVSRLEVAEP
jgi:hypothetical protein